MKKELRFPTILGLLFLFIGTSAGIYLVRKNQNQNTSASGSCEPQSIEIANITDKGCDISFITSDSCNASISVNNILVNDIRQISSSTTYTSKTHYFEVDGLKTDTEVNYSIISGGNTFMTASYKIKTAQKPSTSIPTSNLAWGKIYNSDRSPASKTLVYLNIKGASPLSAYVTTNGNWNISLANSLNDTKTSWFTPPENLIEDIIVVAEGQKPVIFTGNTSFNNPVPDIILGETLTLNYPKTTPTTIVPTSFPTNSPISKSLTITSPLEGEFIAGRSPQFLGISSPNSVVSLNLSSGTQNFTNSITSKNDGTWSWPLNQNLLAGQFTLLANSNGGSATRVFYVSDTISGPAFVSSPSATIAITPTIIYPTNTPFITDMPIPTQRASRPSTTSAVPVTGVATPTVLITIFGLIITFAGILILK